MLFGFWNGKISVSVRSVIVEKSNSKIAGAEVL